MKGNVILLPKDHLSIKFLTLLKSRFAVLFFIFLLVIGCSSPHKASDLPKGIPPTPTAIPTPTLIPTPTPTAIPTPTLIPTPTPIPLALGTSVTFTLGGAINIQSNPGFICHVPEASFLPGTLVLPTVQPTYDEGTLQLMKNYLTTSFQNTGNGELNTVPFPAFPFHSDMFQLVPVDLVPGSCSETLQITNIGNIPLQISQISVQLSTDTQINHQQYHLINACSFDSLFCFNGGGGQSASSAIFDLHSGKAHTIVLPMCDGASLCASHPLNLQPGEVTQVALLYNVSDNLSFSLLPSFTLNWPGAKKQPITYSTPQLQATFAVAAASQFSCYTLQKQHFVKVSVGPLSPYRCI